MNLYEIYFSPTGGTKKVADIMIKAMKKDAQEIDMIKDPDKILQTEFSCCTNSWVNLLLPVIILTTAGLALRGQEHFCYESRWLWGAVFLSLLLFLSIQKTAYSQFEASSEHPTSLLSRWAREEQQR